MPFKSEAQRRLFHLKASRGEISEETVHEWEHATKNKKSLPMHVKKHEHEKKAYVEGSHRALHEYLKLAAAPVMPLTPSQRLATAVIQGGSSMALNAMMGQPGDRARQMGIGGVSDFVGGYLGGGKGMMASMGTNMALQHLTAPKPHFMPPPPPQQFEYKQADHADDRLKERIKVEFPPNALQHLRDQAKKLELSPGKYYLPLKGPSGSTAAVAAFKTVGKDNKLVLATVLNPKEKPPAGVSLSHLMTQPRGQELGKVEASQKHYTIRKDSNGRYTCSCRDFKFRRSADGTNCKHIEAYLKKDSPPN